MRFRAALAFLHRWMGLSTALFLFMAGLTGAIIGWHDEIDERLNPVYYKPRGEVKAPLSPLEAARRVEEVDPRVRVGSLSLDAPAGEAPSMYVVPKRDPATGKPFKLDYNNVAVDYGTGAVLDRRYWGAPSLTRKGFVAFLYRLHYNLGLPEGRAADAGMRIMGIVAVVWLFDCFAALALSFPSVREWRKSFVYRWRTRDFRLLFDLHRSTGVWVWGLLLLIAVTAISMNLGDEVMKPLVSSVSRLTPGPFDRAPRPPDDPVDPAVSMADAVASARREAAARGWKDPAGEAFYSPDYGVYGVEFFKPGDEDAAGLGKPELYYDGVTGKLVGDAVPGKGSAGDVFMQAQFPIHSGRLFGKAGRAYVSIMGLLIAALSATGVLIWIRKLARFRR